MICLLYSFPFQWKAAALTLTLALALLYKFLQSSRNKSYCQPPEPPGAWPLIGHLRLFTGRSNIGRDLGAVANKHGAIFTLRLGARRTVVVNSWELAKECLATNDRALANRPKSAAGKYMGYNYAMVGLAPYGDYWRELRKICTTELLSSSRLEKLNHVWEEEVNIFIKKLHNHWADNNQRYVKIEMRQWFMDLTLSIMVRMVAGKRCFRSDEYSDKTQQFSEVISDFTMQLCSFIPSDFLPFLGWLDLGGYERAMRRTATKMDSILRSWLKEHQRRRIATGLVEGKLDFMDALLNIVKKGHLTNFDPDTIVKANSLILILAGTETTGISLSWALSLLLNHPHILKKAKQEIDNLVGQDRHIQGSDLKNLVYLQAIVKETLRLYPPGPIIVPHEAIENCIIGGYNVCAGTQVLVNVWTIQRDPKVWTNPLEFDPERFLTSYAEVDVRGQNFALLPFGSGKRSCPGASFALQIMHLTLARLIHEFDIASAANGLVDMREGGGIALQKATPFSVTFVPRLFTKLLQQC